MLFTLHRCPDPPCVVGRVDLTSPSSSSSSSSSPSPSPPHLHAAQTDRLTPLFAFDTRPVHVLWECSLCVCLVCAQISCYTFCWSSFIGFWIVFRLRSVKMEQRKLNDQANSLVDLAKVSPRLHRTRGQTPLPTPLFYICVLELRCMPGHWRWPCSLMWIKVYRCQINRPAALKCISMADLVFAHLRFSACGLERMTLDFPV